MQISFIMRSRSHQKKSFNFRLVENEHGRRQGGEGREGEGHQ